MQTATQTTRLSARRSPETASVEHRSLGTALLAAGIVLATAIVALIGVAIYDADALPLIEYLRDRVGSGHNFVDAVIGGRSVRIRGSHGFGYALALNVYAWLLVALATVSRALIQNGTRLLRRVD